MPNKKVVTIAILATLITLPMFSLALDLSTPPPAQDGVTNLILVAVNIIDLLWKFFAVVAILMFMWSGAMFLLANGEASKIKDSRHAFYYGVVGVFVAILGFSMVTIIGNVITSAPPSGNGGNVPFCASPADCPGGFCNTATGQCFTVP